MGNRLVDRSKRILKLKNDFIQQSKLIFSLKIHFARRAKPIHKNPKISPSYSLPFIDDLIWLGWLLMYVLQFIKERLQT
ncbi:hypothetical protein DLK05_03595 [Ancylomarina longa]|uniref:Uncharacterized protein n=1 Tax=Ancylomarina longa TaxID=2487017 RepID=A0A434AXN6_9BACT|nr:hypothetical protein DLK05_03595 [Ancylomarina longa]